MLVLVWTFHTVEGFFFQACYDHYCTLNFDASLNDLDFPSRSQFYKKARSPALS